MKYDFNKIWEIGLEILFPSRCGVCGRLSTNSLCKKCEIQLEKWKVCKKQIKIRQEDDYTLLYLFPYTGIVREKLIELKFKDRPDLAKMFVKIFLADEKICRFLKSYDIIIPVPAYSTKKWERGYNQTERILKELRKIEPNWQYEFRILKKVKNTKRQSSLKREDRKTNLKDAYQIQKKDKLIGKKVLLFDDIYTTR